VEELVENKAPTVRILIADDHPMFREGLRTLLEREPGFVVVGAARDGDEAVTLVQELGPDILLLDVAMPRRPGLEALRELAALSTAVRTILLTGGIDKSEIVTALQLGARGVVRKEADMDLLFRGIRSVMAGEYWVGRECVSDLVQTIRQMSISLGASGIGANKFGLTARELEITAYVAAACTNKDIAQKCSISENTVKHHLSKVFDKVGASTRAELALFATHHGLLDIQ
jgi:two-component system nitrate/nitrite response regulator NarL